MKATETLATSPGPSLHAAAGRDAANRSDAEPARARGGSRPPGRPLEMPPDVVLRTIRQLSRRRDGLFRVHLAAPSLYARARRLYGTWSAAVRAAGIDYESLRRLARARSIRSRRRTRRDVTRTSTRVGSARGAR